MRLCLSLGLLPLIVAGCANAQVVQSSAFSVASATGPISVTLDGAAAGIPERDLAAMLADGIACGVRRSGLSADSPIRNASMNWSINGHGRTATQTMTMQLQADDIATVSRTGHVSLQHTPRAGLVGAICDLTAQSLLAASAASRHT